MRSKVLLVTNIIVTLYDALWVYVFGSIYVAGRELLEASGGLGEFFEAYIELLFRMIEMIFEMGGINQEEVMLIYASIILFLVHILSFLVGSLIGWIAYFRRKSGGAMFAAVIYLIGTICVPVSVFWCLPIVIMGFVGGSKQKKINFARIV